METYELGPVDLYLTVLPTGQTLSLSLSGYVSDLFLELARLHHIPFYTTPTARVGDREYAADAQVRRGARGGSLSPSKLFIETISRSWSRSWSWS